MRFSYDLHVHSCLSPCGDADMTPNNIVHLASLLGIEILALTDHNSCGNCAAAAAVGKKAGVLVVPGMELCTAEEIHVICLMPDCSAAQDFSELVQEHSPYYANRAEIFGEQLLMDENDEVTGHEDRLLIAASAIPATAVKRLVEGFGGICFPAHIEKDSYSILSVLGGWPEECGFLAAELQDPAQRDNVFAQFRLPTGLRILSSSDAHYLEQLGSAGGCIELPERSIPALFTALRGGVFSQQLA